VKAAYDAPMKRFAALFSFALLAAACGGKSKPMATAPANTTSEPEAAAPGGADEAGASDDADPASKAAPPAPEDPCGGDE
jgi:hypothetical protein